MSNGGDFRQIGGKSLDELAPVPAEPRLTSKVLTVIYEPKNKGSHFTFQLPPIVAQSQKRLEHRVAQFKINNFY